MAKSEGERSVLTLSLLVEQLSMYGVHLYELTDRVNINHKRMLYLQRKKADTRSAAVICTPNMSNYCGIYHEMFCFFDEFLFNTLDNFVE